MSERERGGEREREREECVLEGGVGVHGERKGFNRDYL